MTQLELIEKIKREHVGKWIGLKGDSIVTISDTHEDLYKEM